MRHMQISDREKEVKGKSKKDVGVEESKRVLNGDVWGIQS